MLNKTETELSTRALVFRFAWSLFVMTTPAGRKQLEKAVGWT
jgi:hypothetical protein